MAEATSPATGRRYGVARLPGLGRAEVLILRCASGRG